MAGEMCFNIIPNGISKQQPVATINELQQRYLSMPKSEATLCTKMISFWRTLEWTLCIHPWSMRFGFLGLAKSDTVLTTTHPYS